MDNIGMFFVSLALLGFYLSVYYFINSLNIWIVKVHNKKAATGRKAKHRDPLDRRRKYREPVGDSSSDPSRTLESQLDR